MVSPKSDLSFAAESCQSFVRVRETMVADIRTDVLPGELRRQAVVPMDIDNSTIHMLVADHLAVLIVLARVIVVAEL